MSERVTETVDVGGGSQIERSYDIPTPVAGPGVGSGATDRAVYGSDANPVGDGDLVGFVLNRQIGRALLDLTVPQTPVVLIAGTYAASLWIQLTSAQAGKHLRIDFELDANDFDPTFESGFVLDAPAPGQLPTLTLGGTSYIPLGGSLFATINTDVVGPLPGFIARLWLQLLYEA